MIWALLAWYFLGGPTADGGPILTSASVAELEQRVEAVVDDVARRKAAKRTLKELGKHLKGFEKSFRKSGRQLNKLYLGHEENQAEALQILDELNADWQVGQTSTLDARFRLREILTESEWAALFADYRF